MTQPATEPVATPATPPGTTAPSPEAYGIPSAAVLDLLDALENGGLDPHGLVVARDGVPRLVQRHPLAEVEPGHMLRCHIPLEELRGLQTEHPSGPGRGPA